MSSMLGHFGGSNYGYKPSAILTYSPGPWGGMRCAMALRPMLSELGCTPVSRVCGIPTVDEIFESVGEDGKVAVKKDAQENGKARVLGQLGKMMDQLEWHAVACKKMRADCAGP